MTLSFAKVPESVLATRSLSPGQKLTYAYLAAFADRNGFTYVRAAAVTARFPIDGPCLSRAKKALGEKGFLYEGEGKYGKGIYLLSPPCNAPPGNTPPGNTPPDKQPKGKEPKRKKPGLENPKPNLSPLSLPDLRGSQSHWNRNHADEYRAALRKISTLAEGASGTAFSPAKQVGTKPFENGFNYRNK